MRTSLWIVSTLAILIFSVGLKFQLASVSASTVDSAPSPLVVAAIDAASASESATSSTPDTGTTTVEIPPAETPAQKPAMHREPAPVQPQKQTAQEPVAPVQKTMGTSEQFPERLIIPSLDMNVTIQPVGLNDKGEMDVPSGSSSNVGWYKDGTMPGNVGSAVLDAHVFAVFKDLKDLKLGSSVYVATRGGTKLRFKVVDSRIYTLSELTSNILFGQHDARRLNLITCAGTYIPSINTYDHRLVVFAVFQDEE